jgi:hypothetical protein
MLTLSWNYFEVILELFWSYPGIILKLSRNYFEVILELFWSVDRSFANNLQAFTRLLSQGMTTCIIRTGRFDFHGRWIHDWWRRATQPIHALRIPRRAVKAEGTARRVLPRVKCWQPEWPRKDWRLWDFLECLCSKIYSLGGLGVSIAGRRSPSRFLWRVLRLIWIRLRRATEVPNSDQKSGIFIIFGKRVATIYSLYFWRKQASLNSCEMLYF